MELELITLNRTLSAMDGDKIIKISAFIGKMYGRNIGRNEVEYQITKVCLPAEVVPAKPILLAFKYNSIVSFQVVAEATNG